MQFFGKVIDILNYKAETPQLFGWVHILSFCLAIALGIFLSVKFKRSGQSATRRILLAASVITIALEIYKQFIFSFSFDGQTVSFDYQWYAFPFQFCSTPMYVQLIAAFVKNKLLHNALCSFLSTYGIFGGLVVMIYPADVFIDVVGVNIQTMVCHGLMLSVGIYLLAVGHVKSEHKTMLGAMSVFGVIVAVAVILNEALYYSGVLGGETCNLLYVSRHFAPSLPVYSLVQAVVPYPFCLFIYVAGFSAAAYLILLCAIGVRKIADAVRAKRALTV
ncbi:MAG: YwaF family protein [Clostridia bacterium]|nr:YwaF family protein [Clostridia bacterium]